MPRRNQRKKPKLWAGEEDREEQREKRKERKQKSKKELERRKKLKKEKEQKKFFDTFHFLPETEVMDALKDGVVEPNTQHKDTGRTVLSLACSRRNRTSLVKSLLCDAGLGVAEYINTPDLEGLTPLHHAAASGIAENIDLCLRFGADPKCKDQNGQTPLHLACGRHRKLEFGGVAYRQKNQQMDCMDLLINADPTLMEERDNNGRTPIFHCVRGVGTGVSWHLMTFLLERGAQLTELDNEGQNLVHHVLKEVGCHFMNEKEKPHHSVPPRVLFETQILFRLMVNLEPQLLSQRDGSCGAGAGLTPFMTVCFWGNADLIFYFLKEHCAVQELM